MDRKKLLVMGKTTSENLTKSNKKDKLVDRHRGAFAEKGVMPDPHDLIRTMPAQAAVC